VIEKGDVFQIQVKISASAHIKNITVIPILPVVFFSKPMLPSIPQYYKTIKSLSQYKIKGSIVKINSLYPGSEIIIPFKVFSPSAIAREQVNGTKYTYTTEENKYIGANVFYELCNKQTYKVFFYLSKNIYKSYHRYANLFDFWYISIFLSFIVKTITKQRKKIVSMLRLYSSYKTFVRILKYIFIIFFKFPLINRFTEFSTSLILGFGVLIILAEKSHIDFHYTRFF